MQYVPPSHYTRPLAISVIKEKSRRWRELRLTWSTWLASPVGQRCLLGVQAPSCSPGCLWKKYPTVASSWDLPLSGGCGVPGLGWTALSMPCKCGTPGDCTAPPTVARGPPPWTLTPPDSGAPFACSIPPLVSCQATSFIPRMLHGMLIPRESLNNFQKKKDDTVVALLFLKVYNSFTIHV